jgi:Transposase IS116/IS110/IS902 family
MEGWRSVSCDGAAHLHLMGGTALLRFEEQGHRPPGRRRSLAPVPRDSGQISGNLHRPRRCNRRLLRVFYLSAQVAARRRPISKQFYERKRAEGKGHKQAILALVRRQLNIL